MGLLLVLLSRVLIVLAAIWLLRWLAGALFGRRPARSVRGSRPASITGELKKDPTCGAYIATETALKIRSGTEELCFCSPQCHEEYVKAHRERPA